jgi:flavin reductase (DIM6/NTAB) family NADH-FMN oxidoreductase RutF
MPVDALEDAMPCDTTAFRHAMRRVASSVALVTCGIGAERRGLTATAVCSVCAEPPTILACVNRSTQAHDVIEGTGRFCINLLGRDHTALAETFAGRRGLVGLDRFANGRWQDSPRGSGPLLVDGLAWLDCRVIRVLSVATHTVFLGLVEDTRVAENGATLAYCDGSFFSIDVGRPQLAQ